MAVTQYIGARYVPLFAEPLDWDDTREYEPLTIVYHQGNSYTSRQSVPKGIDIEEEAFWALTGNYNAQVEAYRREVKAFDGRITANAKAIADEVTRAVAAEAEAITAINAEADRAKAAEETISAEVAAEADRAKAAEAEEAARAKTAEADETERAKAAEEAISANLAEEMERAKAAEQDNRIVDCFHPEIINRQVREWSYLYSNPPTPLYDSVQGGCWGKNGTYAALFSPGLEIYRRSKTSYLNTVKLREFNADGTIVRESATIEAGHGNGLCYNPANDQYVICDNYSLAGDYASTRTANAKITLVNGSTLVKERDIDLSAYVGSSVINVSYCAEDGTMFAANTDDWKGIYLDPKTYEPIGATVDLSKLSAWQSKLATAYNESRRQVFTHTKNYFVMLYYMPNMLMFFERKEDGTMGELVKVSRIDKAHTYEVEFIDILEDGEMCIGGHKRFYSRKGSSVSDGKEVVSNIATIYRTNIYTDSFELDYFDNTAVSTRMSIAIDPSTDNVIQNGSPSYPCRSAMEAYWLYTARENDNPCALWVPSSASGTVTWLRISNGSDMTIVDESKGNVTWANNFLVQDSSIVLNGLHWGSYSSSGRQPYEFMDGYNIGFLRSNVKLYSCSRSVYDSTKVRIDNSVTITSNTLDDGITYTNSNLHN